MNNKYRKILVILCLLGLAEGASASIYKCVDAKGNTTFSDTPCSSSAEIVQKDDHDDTGEKTKAKTPPKKTKGGWSGYIDRARKIGE